MPPGSWLSLVGLLRPQSAPPTLASSAGLCPWPLTVRGSEPGFTERLSLRTTSPTSWFIWHPGTAREHVRRTKSAPHSSRAAELLQGPSPPGRGLPPGSSLAGQLILVNPHPVGQASLVAFHIAMTCVLFFTSPALFSNLSTGLWKGYTHEQRPGRLGEG